MQTLQLESRCSDRCLCPWSTTRQWRPFVCVQLGMLQEGAEQAQRQEAAAKAVLKAAQVGPGLLQWNRRMNSVISSHGRRRTIECRLSCTARGLFGSHAQLGTSSGCRILGCWPVLCVSIT